MGDLVYLSKYRADKCKKIVVDGVELDIEEDEEETIKDVSMENFETIFGDQNKLKE